MQHVEWDIERLLVPIEPSADFRERLHEALVASADGAPGEVIVLSQSRLMAWFLSVTGVVLGALVLQYIARVLSRQH